MGEPRASFENECRHQLRVFQVDKTLFPQKLQATYTPPPKAAHTNPLPPRGGGLGRGGSFNGDNISPIHLPPPPNPRSRRAVGQRAARENKRERRFARQVFEACAAKWHTICLFFAFLMPNIAHALGPANLPDFRHKLGFASLIFLGLLFFCLRAWKESLEEEKKEARADTFADHVTEHPLSK